MKTINKILSTLIIVLVYTSCGEDRLNVTPLNETESDYFAEEAHFTAAVGATYTKLAEFYCFNNNNPRVGFYALPGDDITTDGADNYEVFSTLEAGDAALGHHYASAYEVISRANVLLQKLDDEELSSAIKTPNLKNYMKGEALFLRGYINFYLWNYFGTAPLVIERIQSQDGITPPSSEGTQLIDQAISDLQEAANLLPAEWSAADRGRVTKNSANGMLGKALVYRASWIGNSQDYTAAIAAFEKIQGAQLVSNFADNFNSAAENNAESLFEYQSSNQGNDNVWLSNDDFSSIGTFTAYWGYFENHWSLFGKQPYLATQKLIDIFEDGDPRAALTVNPDNAKIQKYWTQDQKSSTGVGSMNNPRILRYADVLLLWAEALNETGNQNDAIDKINQIRTRARNMDSTGVPADRATGATQEQVRSWIQDERLMELAGEEGHRWLDLRRWHQAGHINLATWDFSSRKDNFDIELPTNLLYPIPTSEIDRNKNVMQNSGY